MASGPGSGDGNAAPSAAAGTPAFFGMPNIRPLRVSEGLNSLAAEWRSWRQLWDAYTIITGLDKKPNEFQASMFIASVGVDALTIVNALPYARQEDRKDLLKVLDLMERHCIGVESESYERFKFYSRSQGDGQPFENFLTAQRTLVRTCNFRKDSVDYSAEMIRDRIIMGIRDSGVRRRILMKNDADLDLCVKECRTSETTNRQTLDMATGPV